MTQHEKISKLLDLLDYVKEEVREIQPVFDGIKHNPELPLDLRVDLVSYYHRLKNIGGLLEKPGCVQHIQSPAYEEELAITYAKTLRNLINKVLDQYGSKVRYEKNGEYIYTYSQNHNYDQDIASLTSVVFLIAYDKLDIANYTKEITRLSISLGWLGGIFNFRQILQLKNLIKEKEKDIQTETVRYEFEYAKWKRKNK